MAMDTVIATLEARAHAVSASKFLLRVIYSLEAYIQSDERRIKLFSYMRDLKNVPFMKIHEFSGSY